MPFIIDVRRTLPWRRRALSDLATAALWLGWAALCLPPMFGLVQAVMAHGQRGAAALAGIADARMLDPPVLVALGISALMWLAPRLARPVAREAAPAPDYAAAFGVDPSELDARRDDRICVLHHDDAGRIVAIEAPDPSPPAVGDTPPQGVPLAA